MSDLQCLRCRRRNRPVARYCGTCGRRLPYGGTCSRGVSSAEQQGGVVSWILLITLIVALLLPESSKPEECSGAAACRGAIGLVMDFPPDYPNGYFSRRAFPSH